jgi:RecA-family ATPase
MKPEPDIEQLLEAQYQKLKAVPKPNGAPPKRGPTPLQPTDALDIYKAQYPPVQFVVDGLLPRGLTLAAGRPKVGKSWLTLQLAVAVAFGERALGRFRVTIPGRVAYLALEEPQERTHRRLRAIVTNADARLQNLRFLYERTPLMQGTAAELAAFLTGHPSS